MSELEDDISNARTIVEKAYNNVINKSTIPDGDLKKDILYFFDDISKNYKKTSEEFKYLIKLKKNFSDMNDISIKFFIESNYDRMDEIRNLLLKYTDNFNDEEMKKYEARYVILEKSMMFILEKGI